MFIYCPLKIDNQKICGVFILAEIFFKDIAQCYSNKLIKWSMLSTYLDKCFMHMKLRVFQCMIKYSIKEIRYFLRSLMLENDIVCCNSHVTEENVLGIIIFTQLYICTYCVLLGLIRR